MKKKLFLLAFFIPAMFIKAQNVGINNANPQFPLSFNGSLGDKISLWTDGTPTHYGMGIQPGLFQVFSKTAVDDIVFGYGSSTAFTERMRMKNSGEFGVELNGRILLRNGTFPIDINFTPGIWLNKADNSGLLGFMGTQNNQNIGFYGGPSGWGFTYNALNSSVGIGTAAAHASAVLDISSTTKAFLPPRMTMAERNSINAGYPAVGLIVHCTDCTPAGPYSYTGTTWASMTSSPAPGIYTIGQAAQGGIVFWVDDSGQHGLVAAPNDLSAGATVPWSTTPLVYCNVVRKDGIYIGQLNSDSIIRNYSSYAGGSAAGQCAQLIIGGYGDWYLPSNHELMLLWAQKAVVGGFASAPYWSSTEYSTTTASTLHFTTFFNETVLKTESRRVRAIRRF